MIKIELLPEIYLALATAVLLTYASFNKFNLTIKKRNKNQGEYILICPSSLGIHTYLKKLDWIDNTIEEIVNGSDNIENRMDMRMGHPAKNCYPCYALEKDKNSFRTIDIKYKYPIRPIILGGDDLTVIIRADLAIPFTECFLREFEQNTKELFSNLKTKKINTKK